MRTIVLPSLFLLCAMFACGCTALIDLEPDCESAVDCGAYQCNEAGTACLSECASSEECASGAWCARDRGECVIPACEVISERVNLEGIDERFSESALAVLSSESIAPQALALVSGSVGTGAVRYAAPDFSLIHDGDRDDFIVNRLETPSRRPVQPAIAVLEETGDRAGLYWVQTTDAATQLQTVRLDAADGELSPRQTVWSQSEQVRVNALRVVPDEDGVWATWQQTAPTSFVANLQRISGSGQGGTIVQLSSEGVDARFPTVVVNGGVAHSFWFEPQATSIWSIYSRSFDAEGDEVSGRREVRREVSLTPLDVSHVSDGERLYQMIERGELEDRDVTLRVLNPETYDVLAKFELSDEFDRVREVRAYAAESGVILLIYGDLDGERGLWLRFVDGEEGLNTVPLRVATPAEEQLVVRPHLDGREGGLWLMWTEEHAESGRARTYLRGFRCDDFTL